MSTSQFRPLVRAELAVDHHGTPWSARYGDVYHSRSGGLEQARHVFIEGNNLTTRWAEAVDNSGFVILETGFGLGLNFLATWKAWQSFRAAQQGAPEHLHFISIEKHPFCGDDLAALLEGYPELKPIAGELLTQWPPLVPGFHRLLFAQDAVTLTLIFGDATTQLREVVAHIDALYLDGFSPDKNPDIWSTSLLAQISRRCHTKTTLATWSVAAPVRQALERTGWQLDKRPGFAHKRDMLVGHRQTGNITPSTPSTPSTPITVSPAPTLEARSTAGGSRSAIVIGAGLAGCAISERLAARGWQVELFDRHSGVAQEASGNPAGALYPLLTQDDAPAARLSRASFLYALRRLSEMSNRTDLRWESCGVLQIARDAEHAAIQRKTLESLRFPHDFAQFLEHPDAELRIGHTLALGGWWFPNGGWVSPVSLCLALLDCQPERIKLQTETEVASIQRNGDGWLAMSIAGQPLASAPHLILANAIDANALLTPLGFQLPLTAIRGQVSYLPEDTAAASRFVLRHVVCRTGYVTPRTPGTACIGASFDRDDTDTALRTKDHCGNLQRLDELLPGLAKSIDPTTLAGRAGIRTAASDRLPLVGTLLNPFKSDRTEPSLATLHRQRGLHALLGLGARGLVWAPLAAELLASQLNGDPLPLEQNLINAIDPARFYLRQRRAGSTQ